MFGWSKKEEKKPANPRRKANLSNFGLFDIPGDYNQMGADGDGDTDDEDLEAELAKLTTGGATKRPKKKPAPAVDLDAMVAASMRDIPSDEEIASDDDDPALLEELGDLLSDEDEAQPAPVAPPRKTSAPAAPAPSPATPAASRTGGLVGLLEERLDMYKKAEAAAKQAGDSSRARRFNRGYKTLTDQLRQAKAGRPVPEDDIPPPVSVTAGSKPAPTPVQEPEPVPEDTKPPPIQEPLQPIRAPPPVPPAPITVEPKATEENSILAELERRQLLFKQSALNAKRTGDSESAVKYLRISKQFDSVIAAVKSGNPVDLSEMLDPPSNSAGATATIAVKPAAPRAPQPVAAETQASSEPADPEALPEPLPTPKAPSLPVELLEPPAPSSVAEALSQRLARYQAEEKLAKDAGNTSKARRMGRITKQYQDAIKLHKAGRPIPVDELPTPPGFAPIPVPGGAAPAAPPAPAAAEGPQEPETPQPPKVSRPPKPDAPRAEPQPPPRKSPQTRQEKQTAELLAKQKAFKEAALNAKKQGDLEAARELLRQAKGFDMVIQASQSGLPVDFSTLPVLPSLNDSTDSEFEYVSQAECAGDEATEIYQKIEEDLKKQLKLCIATRDHFKATGDVAGANRFDQLALQTKRDYNMVKACHLRGETLPRFRYENRAFQILQCNTDLGENDLELVIVQGISYTVPNPKEIDTYVKFEFPFPSENPPKDKTALIRDTNNPQYNHNFTLAIARNSRPCQRMFKRQAIKLEVWSKGGFLRSDTLLGTVNVKLLPLETQCTIHETFPLMDGRKAVGGQLEVKVRVRHPIVTWQVEQRQERWIVVAPDDK